MRITGCLPYARQNLWGHAHGRPTLPGSVFDGDTGEARSLQQPRSLMEPTSPRYPVSQVAECESGWPWELCCSECNASQIPKGPPFATDVSQREENEDRFVLRTKKGLLAEVTSEWRWS